MAGVIFGLNAHTCNWARRICPFGRECLHVTGQEVNGPFGQ